MGINYGKKRNRSEDLPALRETVLSSIGATNINYEKYDYQQVADQINENLDSAQDRYNEKYNFPPNC
ncbi:MAG: hypothetical protein ACC656_05655 [Candidatus Heimdallarchaeota archaeon]